jgi:hypothetical protein
MTNWTTFLNTTNEYFFAKLKQKCQMQFDAKQATDGYLIFYVHRRRSRFAMFSKMQEDEITLYMQTRNKHQGP